MFSSTNGRHRLWKLTTKALPPLDKRLSISICVEAPASSGSGDSNGSNKNSQQGICKAIVSDVI